MKTASIRSTRTVRGAAEALESRIAPAVILGLDDSNNIHAFSSSTGSIHETIAVTGLGVGETLAGIDFRPANGLLYALGITDGAGVDDSEGRIYTINLQTGVATQVGASAFSTTLVDGASYGFDFNPTTAAAVRITNSADQNFRFNTDTGALVSADGTVAFGPADPNFGVPVDLVGSAYINSFAGPAPSTTLFSIDAANDVLVSHSGAPGFATLNTVGPLGVNADATVGGFDIASGTPNLGTAALKVGGETSLFSINLATGAATEIAPIGTGTTNILGLALVPGGLTFANPYKAIWTDVDGDTVTLVTKSTTALRIGDFTLRPQGALGGAQLTQLNFSDDLAEFAGSGVSITAKRSGTGGDGNVNVGHINAAGVDLGPVKVEGDLAQLDAGDATTTTAGVTKVDVLSIGRFGTSTQGAGGTVEYDILGPVNSFLSRASIVLADIHIDGGADADVGTFSVGASIQSSTVRVEGSIGKINSAGVTPDTFVTSGGANIKGNLRASSLIVGEVVSKLRIGADLDSSTISILGNPGAEDNLAATALGSATINGDVGSSKILVGYDGTTAVSADVRVGKIKTGGDWLASSIAVGVDQVDTVIGNGDDALIAGGGSATIVARLASVQVKGQIIGTPGGTDSFGFVAEEIGAFKVTATPLPLTPGIDDLPVGATGDVRVREYPFVVII